MLDHLPTVDVEGFVGQAFREKEVPQAADCPLLAKRFDCTKEKLWSLSRHVPHLSGIAKALLSSIPNIFILGPLDRFQQAEGGSMRWGRAVCGL